MKLHTGKQESDSKLNILQKRIKAMGNTGRVVFYTGVGLRWVDGPFRVAVMMADLGPGFELVPKSAMIGFSKRHR